MSCPDCNKHKLKAHQFETPCDYELHAENALTTLYGENNFMAKVMDELLYTMDHLEKPDKNKLMAMLLVENPQYDKYLTSSKECKNIKGCHGKSCDCLSFKTYSDLSQKEKEKVKLYAKLFYNQ